MNRLWDNLSRADIFLMAAGAVCLFLYVVLSKAVYPDAVVSRSLSTAEVREIADVYVRSHGGSTEGLSNSVSFLRDSDLMKVAQAHGRSALRDLVAHNRLPGYTYEVKYREVSASSTNLTISDRYVVRITPTGKVWSFRDDAAEADAEGPDGSHGRSVDRAALFVALSGDSTHAESLSQILSLDDSTLVRRVRFDVRSFLGQAEPPDFEAPRSRLPRRAGLIFMRPASAIAMARRFAEPAVEDGMSLTADSVWIEQGFGAGVRFQSVDSAAGFVRETDVVVTSVGGLVSLRQSFRTLAPQSENRLNAIRPVAMVAVYLILGMILLIVFFRRLMIRAIDVRSALIDTTVFSVAFVMFMILAAGLYQPGLPLWTRFLGIGATLGIGGALMALVVFLASAATDSIVRRAWPKKLVNINLLRQGLILNSFVGGSIVRGISVGFIALAASVASLALIADAPLKFESTTFATSFVQPAVAAFGYAAWGAFVTTMLLVLTAGSLLYRDGRSALLSVVPVVVVFALANNESVEFSNVFLSWGSHAAIGLVIALAFRYFDGLTCFVALFVYTLARALQEGWIMQGSPYLLDSIAGILVLLGLGVIGFIGISRGRPTGSSLEYVPQYLKEMGEQQRLQRELEIARHVQESFLPKTMPDYPGVDIAATCIPAETVGGDYYDFVSMSSGRLGIALGDVSGKGIQAAFFMTLTKGFLRSLSQENLSPSNLLQKVNSLFRDAAPRGVFVSLIFGILDAANGTFTFGRAGHNPVILKRREDAEARMIRPDGLGIGLAPESSFRSSIKEETIALDDGDLLVLYTDGFSEARGVSREEYGDDRLARIVTRNADLSATEILNAICDDVVHFCGSESTHDDRTVLVLKVVGSNR